MAAWTTMLYRVGEDVYSLTKAELLRLQGNLRAGKPIDPNILARFYGRRVGTLFIEAGDDFSEHALEIVDDAVRREQQQSAVARRTRAEIKASRGLGGGFF